MYFRATSSRPQRAPKDYESLPPCEKRERDDAYVGSGVTWEDHPWDPAAHSWVHGRPLCLDCGSRDVLVIFLIYGGSNVGRDLNAEVVCQDCGTYSHHKWTD